MSLDFQCICRDRHGHWLVVQEKTMIVPRNTVRHESLIQQNAPQSLLAKTAEFGKRFFVGSLGSLIPLATGVGYQYFTNSTLPTAGTKLYELGLYTAGLGLCSSATASSGSSAFKHGIMFGSVAQITSALGGIGDGKSWESVANRAVDMRVKLIAGATFLGTQALACRSWISSGCQSIATRFSSAAQAFCNPVKNPQ